MNASRRTNRAATALGMALAAGAALLALTGCAGFEYREAVCWGGEYPVLSVGGTGSACVPDAEQPPSGFARYPEGKVPEQVDDKWDVYWDTHTLDANGKVVEVG
jgi:hypothetical protein